MLPVTVSILALIAGDAGVNVTLLLTKSTDTEEAVALIVITPVIGTASALVAAKRAAKMAPTELIFIFIILFSG